MKITIEEREAAQDIEVTIVCARADRRVLDIAARLRMLDRKVTGTADGCTRVLSAEDVLFIESVDKHTFIYTANTVLETGLRLYEMEERLADCEFLDTHARLVLFSVGLYMALCALAVFLGWFPVSDPGAWVTFTVVYLAILAVLTLLFNAKLSRETRELNDRLAEYRKSRETE